MDATNRFKQTIIQQYKTTRNILQVVCPNTGIEYTKLKAQWLKQSKEPSLLPVRDNLIQLDVIYGRRVFEAFEVEEGNLKALIKELTK